MEAERLGCSPVLLSGLTHRSIYNHISKKKQQQTSNKPPQLQIKKAATENIKKNVTRMMATTSVSFSEGNENGAA